MLLKKSRRALIIGCGSIGMRHADILKQIGFDIAGVTHRQDLNFSCFSNIKEALYIFKPSIVVVSTQTSEHYKNCQELEENRFSGIVLIEKPLSTILQSDIHTPSYNAFVAYNLRFHPVIQNIRKLLHGRQIFSAQLSVGQYLPTWRPSQDYRKCYSSHKQQGGGVLRDLSHELDLALWLFGNWHKVTSRIGTWGKLDISTEDTVDILAECSKCPSVTIHLDYQNLFPHRTILIQADGLSLRGDLIKNSLQFNDTIKLFPIDRNFTYEQQWLNIIKKKSSKIVCSWEEGIEVMRFINAIEEANKHQCWEINQ